MFYIMYLTGLCKRRHWPEPQFQTFRTRQGFTCMVRVNNREYNTDIEYETPELAKNAAATCAYMICRNFSVNDGMYPSSSASTRTSGSGTAIQGLPVAIGTGRRGTCSSHDSEDAASASEASSAGTDGGVSPRGSDCALDRANHNRQLRRGSSAVDAAPRYAASVALCYCGRGPVCAYERCGVCLREAGYA